jgi:hypothetical protein
MKIVLSTVTIFVFSVTLVFGQSIPSFWMNYHDLESYHKIRMGNAKEIKVTVSGVMSLGERYKETIKYEFPSSNIITSEVKRDGKITRRNVKELCNNGFVLKMTSHTNHPALGWLTTTKKYDNYEEGRRLLERHYDDEITVTRVFNYEYDHRGWLEKISQHSPEGELISYETANYNTEEFFYTYTVFNSEGKVVSQTKNNFLFNDSLPVLNQFGDPTKVLWPTSSTNTPVYHTLEYRYDKTGNWTMLTRYINADGNKKRRMTVRRNIEYQ